MKFTREDRLNVELADLGSFLREEGQTGQGRGRRRTISAVTLSHSPIMAAGGDGNYSRIEGRREKRITRL